MIISIISSSLNLIVSVCNLYSAVYSDFFFFWSLKYQNLQHFLCDKVLFKNQIRYCDQLLSTGAAFFSKYIFCCYLIHLLDGHVLHLLE